MKLCEADLSKRNPLWILESNYLFIKTKEGSIIPIELNFAQKRLLALIAELKNQNKPIRIVILKARQLGISTISDGVIYATTSQREGINGLIIADDVDGSNYLLDIVKLYHEKMPVHLKPIEKKSNEKKIEFEALHSQILIDTANNENAGRKYTYQCVHLSEVAFFPPNKVKALMAGLLQTVPMKPNTMIIAESTANGIGNYFQELWDSAEKGLNDWTPLFIAWFENPDYSSPAPKYFTLTPQEVKYKQDVLINAKCELSDDQMYWRRLVINNNLKGDDVLFKQEYPAYPMQAFLVSGRGRFNIDVLLDLKAKTIKPIRTEGNWEIFKEPVVGRSYIIGADVAEGLEKGDNSVAQIIDPIGLEQVAKYRGKIEPELFAYELKLFGIKYNEALISVEVNNHGLTVLTVLKDIYSNIFYRKIYDKEANQWTKKIGWQTSAKTKPFLVDNLSIAINGGLKINSLFTVDEHITFVINEDGTCSAQEGKLDDEVMSLGVANQAVIEGNWKDKVSEPKPEKDSLAAYLQEQEKNKDDWRSKYKKNLSVR